MSSQVTTLDSFFASLSNLTLLFEDFPQVSNNQPIIRQKATTPQLRRTRPIEKINWNKYSDGLLNEYAEIKSLFLQGIDVETRKIQDLTKIQESMLKLRELIETHWSELTSYDKRTLEFVAQELLNGFAVFGLENSAKPPKFLAWRIFWVFFRTMLQNAFNPNSLFSPARMKTLMANQELLKPKTSSSSKLLESPLLPVANSFLDLCNEVVRLAQDERQGQEPPFYQTATHEEWSKALREWAANHVHEGPPLSNEAIRRENIYEDRV